MLLIIGLTSANAQKQRDNDAKWSGGVIVGASNFLRTFNMTKKTGINHFDEDFNFSFGLNAARKMNGVVSLEGEWLYGTLSGTSNDPKFPQVITYKTNFNQLTVSGLFNFSNLFSKKKIERSWYLYGKVGVGAAYLDGRWSQAAQNHLSFIVPLGLGLNFRVNDKLNLGIESKINIGNDWVNSGLEWPATGNTYWEVYQNTGIKLSYRFGCKKASKKVVAVSKEPKPVVHEKAVVVPPAEPKVEMVPGEEPVQEIKEEVVEPVEIFEEVQEKRAIVAGKGWKIKNGFVWGELPIDGVVYRVQVLAAYKQMVSEDLAAKNLGVDGPFIEYRTGKVYKYAVAKDFDTYKAAKAYSIELNKGGKYKDTFVVAFKNGLQIK